MTLTDTIFSKRSQAQKGIYCMTPFRQGGAKVGLWFFTWKIIQSLINNVIINSVFHMHSGKPTFAPPCIRF